jgi:hypothetical protein
VPPVACWSSRTAAATDTVPLRSRRYRGPAQNPGDDLPWTPRDLGSLTGTPDPNGDGGGNTGGGALGASRSGSSRSVGECLAGTLIFAGNTGAGITQHTSIRVVNGQQQWRGRNGRWYSDSWGGNGATGGRNAVRTAGKAASRAGAGFALLSGGLSMAQMYESAANDDSQGVAWAALDLVVTGVGILGGPVGFGISVAYFGAGGFFNC